MKTVSVKEAAERLGVTSRAVRRWISKGHFPSAYQLNPNLVNSPFRIPESDIVAFEKQRQAPWEETAER